MVILMNIYQRILQSKYNIYYSPGVECFIFLSITLTLFILFIGELANCVVIHQNKITLYKKDYLKLNLNFGIYLDLIQSSFVNFSVCIQIKVFQIGFQFINPLANALLDSIMILSYKKMKISSCSHEVYIVKF